MSGAILTTKLYAPPFRQNLVNRPGLLRRLNEGLALGQPLSLVSAPAGYGKTTLVSEWVTGTGRSFTWLSLDEGDNDPVRYLTYLVAALQKVHGDVGGSLRNLLGAQKLPIEVLVAMLVNDIAEVPEPFILVLDDYHNIHADFIQQVMQYLLDHLPPNLHMVILTREDPPLTLPRWRVNRKVTEVREKDLRFSIEETAQFFSRTMGLEMNREYLEILGNKTEGWVAGLQLAGLSVQGWKGERIADFVAEFGGSHRYVIDYLVEEVLKQQRDEIRAFLTRTSILNRMNDRLCDELTGRTDSKKILSELEQGNLFLVRLDEHRQWFRYHHLFADFLRTELEEGEELELHKAAARSYEEQGFPIEAIRHLKAAGDFIGVGRLVGKVADGMLIKGEVTTLLAWFEAIPEELIRNNIDLIGYLSCTLLISGQVQKAAKYLELADQFQANSIDSVSWGRILGFRAWLADAWGKPDAMELAEEALKLIGVNDIFLRVFVLVALGRAYRKEGNMRKSTETFREALTIGKDQGFSFMTIGVRVDLSFDLILQGRLKEAEELIQNSMPEFTDKRGELLPFAGMLYIPMGMIKFETNELDASIELMQKGLELCRRTGIIKMMGGDGERTIARALFAMGEKEKALAAITEARMETDKEELPIVAFRHEGVEADLRLKLGDFTWAERWAKEWDLSCSDEIVSLKEQSYFVYVRLLLQQQKYIEAKLLLDKLEQFARQGGRYGRLVSVCVLRGLLCQKEGDQAGAFSYIKEAVTLAAPEHLIRAFLEEGREIVDLLTLVREVEPDFVTILLEGFGQGRSRLSEKPVSNQTFEGVLDPLSDREKEILSLTAQGLTNNQIADRLFITLGTTKWHLNNIYSKLGVKSRTQAVACAQELKLI